MDEENSGEEVNAAALVVDEVEIADSVILCHIRNSVGK